MDIKSVITSHGYSVNSLAKKMEVWQSALSTLVNGKNPTIGKLKEMANALDCSWLEFFKDEISIEDLRRSFPELMAQQAAMAQPVAEPASSATEQPQEKDVEEFSYQDGQQQEQQQMRMHLRGIGDIDVAMPPAPPEKPSQEQPQGTTLVGLVRCPQCGRAIRLFAE